MFFNKKFFDDDKNILYTYDIFFESNRNFTTKHVKVLKIPGFSRFFNDFCSKSKVFSKFLKFKVYLPKFSNSRFPGKVATLKKPRF